MAGPIARFVRWIGIVITVLLITFAALISIFALWPDKAYTPYQVSAAYQAQVDAFDIPDMPDGWTWHLFETSDGTKLRYGSGDKLSNAKATIVFVPGFTDTLSQYGEHLSYWQAAGYHVMGLDLRGQGGSERTFAKHPERPWVKDFGIYAHDLHAFSSSILAEQNRPIIIIGASFGAHTAFRAASEHGLDVDGLILLAPVFRPNTAPLSYKSAKTLIGAMNALGKSKRYALGQHDWQPDIEDMAQPIPCSSEPKRVYIRDAIYAKNIGERMGTATNGWLAGLMKSTESMQSANAISRVNLPISMLLASEDTIIVNANSKAVCEQLSDCKLTVLDGAGHCIPQERDEYVLQMYKAVDDMAARLTSNH